MSPSNSLPELLDKLAVIAESVMDMGRPGDDTHPCLMCLENATEAADHNPDCGYRIARSEISPADLKRVRRLARVIERQE